MLLVASDSGGGGVFAVAAGAGTVQSTVSAVSAAMAADNGRRTITPSYPVCAEC